ncbi:hypothetical protein EJB05_37353 [Eragrostis curvula]|uniref:Knottin scorpion toxin-like domain-containing protein n=1 Tax=Eragrostis curvula TaxID=38414 RepID=A0A5J9TRC3_9POAL|nr:hypothetical protein EJB05_37353 [Eragrostis curvula]
MATRATHLIAVTMFLVVLYCTLLSVAYAEPHEELKCQKISNYRMDECRRHCVDVFRKDFTFFIRVTGGEFECCCKKNLSSPPPQSPPGTSSDVETVAATDDGIHA